MQEFEKSHRDFEKITAALECWFDYDNRRVLYFSNYPRVKEGDAVFPVGEQLVKKDTYTYKNLRGRELPDSFESRRIWPYRATPADQPAVEPTLVPDVTACSTAEETRGRTDDRAAASAASASGTPNLPWVGANHELDFTRLIDRMSVSAKSFDEHPLKPWTDKNWLTDDLRAYIAWELMEMGFRNGLYTLDFVLRSAHPDLDLAKINPAQRTAQLHACWGGGDLKPNEASPSPYSLPENTPELLQALTAMQKWMMHGDFSFRNGQKLGTGNGPIFQSETFSYPSETFSYPSETAGYPSETANITLPKRSQYPSKTSLLPF
ncbi:hypothetical protein AURDEDRAFT_166207 [Auricularia subglabra TFB-10046 SS5]|nr:hypothetical protein AURDEDRAFT_166207 [Auricularia subglabra TFB-10046 SS5]